MYDSNSIDRRYVEKIEEEIKVSLLKTADLHSRICKITSADTNKDCRILFFNSSAEILQNYFISVGLSKHIVDLDFIKTYPESNEPRKTNSINKISISYLEEVKSSLFISYFVNWEFCLRILSEKIGITKFYISDVVDSFLKATSIADQEAKSLFDIMLFARNTIHKNGIQSKETCIKNYKGKEYRFEQNKQVDFLSFENVLFFINETNNLMFQLINKSPIKEELLIEHPIPLEGKS